MNRSRASQKRGEVRKKEEGRCEEEVHHPIDRRPGGKGAAGMRAERESPKEKEKKKPARICAFLGVFITCFVGVAVRAAADVPKEKDRSQRNSSAPEFCAEEKNCQNIVKCRNPEGYIQS